MELKPQYRTVVSKFCAKYGFTPTFLGVRFVDLLSLPHGGMLSRSLRRSWCQHSEMASIDGKERFLNTLNGAQGKSSAVAVYADADDFQSYEVGFVEHADSEEVVLLCLTPKGEPDGRRAIRMEDVLRVDVDTIYTKKLELLYEYRDTIFDKDFRNAPKGASGLRAQLEHARDNHTLVHLVDTNDFGPSGFVQTIGEDYVEIQRIGSNGEPDGLATILYSSISKVHFARRQEQILEFLYRYNFELKRLLSS